jgi:molybdate transport system ATP-binding protein
MDLILENVALQAGTFSLEITAALRGSITEVFGASGAGKKSLLELIAGLRRPSRGKISLAGRVLCDVEGRRWLPPEKRAISYVPQDGALFPHLSVRDNLRYGLRDEAARPETITFSHVVEVLELTGLVDRAPRTLSGGEKQRVALGRAVLAAPQLLLLDEPLTGLDFSLKERVLPYLQRVRDAFNVPMLYVTHAPEEVMALCDDVLCLVGGRVVRQAAPAAIFETSDQPRYRLRVP